MQFLDPRYWHTAVWTGSEMIVFGGMSAGTVYGDAAVTILPPTPGPRCRDSARRPRASSTSVWTGSEMIVWGGDPEHRGALQPGDRYVDAHVDANAPLGRWDASVVDVHGDDHLGRNYGGMLLNDGRYNPSSDT
jgi:hypothetical protein